MKHLLATLAALGATAALSGCGFTPLHAAPSGTATFSQLGVSVGDGKDENDRAAGFMLRQHMLDRTGNPVEPRYTLDIRPSVRQVGLGLTGQDRASRFDSLLEARWELRDTADGAVVDKGRVRSKATFSADRDPYRLLTTSNAAVERVSREVADDILAEVALAIAEQRRAP